MAPKETTPLVEVLHLGLERYLDELSAISSQANKEFALEKVCVLSLSLSLSLYFKVNFLMFACQFIG